MQKFFSNIEKLIEKRKQQTPRYNFNSSIPLAEIETFEKAYGLVLSDSYKQFLHVCNGGMILEYDPSYFIDMTDWEPDGPKKSSFYFFDLTDLLRAYKDARLDDWLLSGSFSGIYPIIPICHTPKGDLIYMVSGKGLDQESPVFASNYHEGEYTCYKVAPDFNTFLGFYLNMEGFPALLPDDVAPSWKEFVKKNRIVEIASKKETYLESIERSTANLQLFPEDEWTYCERGNSYLFNDQPKEALADFNKAIALSEKEGFFYHCRGDLILDFGNPRKALIDLDIAVNIEPENLLFRTRRADAFLKLNKLKRALSDCNIVLEYEAQYKLALSTRIEIYKALGEHDKAAADYDLLNTIMD